MSSHQRSQYDNASQNNTTRIGQAASRPNYVNRTQTTIEYQIQKKLPILVLKLQNQAQSKRSLPNVFGLLSRTPKLSELSDDELDAYIKSNIQEFKDELMKNIDEFQNLVLSAKPNLTEERQNQQLYQVRAENYKQFLRLATEIIKRMQYSFNDIFQKYQEYIDNLWIAICQGEDVRPLQRQFEDQMRQNMNQNWRPVFEKADRLLEDIDKGVNPHPTTCGLFGPHITYCSIHFPQCNKSISALLDMRCQELA